MSDDNAQLECGTPASASALDPESAFLLKAAIRAGEPEIVPEWALPGLEAEIAREDEANAIADATAKLAMEKEKAESFYSGLESVSASNHKCFNFPNRVIIQPNPSPVEYDDNGQISEHETQKYFNRATIEHIRAQKLATLAEADRQKVRSVLHPVDSLLENLSLRAPQEVALVDEIRAKLTTITGSNPATPRSNTFTSTRKEKGDRTYLLPGGFRTCAVEPLDPDGWNDSVRKQKSPPVASPQKCNAYSPCSVSSGASPSSPDLVDSKRTGLMGGWLSFFNKETAVAAHNDGRKMTNAISPATANCINSAMATPGAGSPQTLLSDESNNSGISDSDMQINTIYRAAKHAFGLVLDYNNYCCFRYMFGNKNKATATDMAAILGQSSPSQLDQDMTATMKFGAEEGEVYFDDNDAAAEFAKSLTSGQTTKMHEENSRRMAAIQRAQKCTKHRCQLPH